MTDSKHYWFKPKRFWRWFAAYHPVSAGGWHVSLGCAAVLLFSFVAADRRSHSVSDTLISFAPFAVVVLIIFDSITRSKGEYPAWWKKKKENVRTEP